MPSIVAVIAFLMLPIMANGAGGQEFLPVEFVPASGNIEQADIALDDTSTFHSFWLESDGVLYYRHGAIGASTSNVTINADAEHVRADPALALTTKHGPALVWAAAPTATPGAWDLWYAATPEIAETPTRLMNDAIPDRQPNTIARDDTLFMAWQRGTNHHQVAYGMIARSTTSLQIRLLSQHADSISRPVMANGPGGRIWVAWTVHTGTGGEVWVGAIRGTVIDVPAVPVRKGFADDRNPAVGCDAAGRPYIVWQEGADSGPILYTYGLLDSTGQIDGFAPTLTLTPGAASSPSIEVVPDGSPLVAWRNEGTGDMELVAVVGREVLGPYVLAGGRFSPDLADVAHTLLSTSYGAVIGAFIGRSPTSNASGFWLSAFGEMPTDSFVDNISASVGKTSVRISWSGSGAASYRIVREDVVLPGVSYDPSAGSYFVTDTNGSPGTRMYRLEALDSAGRVLTTDVVRVDVPESFASVGLYAAPNPFNPVTSFRVELPEAATVTVRVFNTSGQLVRSLGESAYGAGVHSVTWDGTNNLGTPVGSGVYVGSCEVISDAGVTRRTVRITLVR